MEDIYSYPFSKNFLHYQLLFIQNVLRNRTFIVLELNMRYGGDLINFDVILSLIYSKLSTL